MNASIFVSKKPTLRESLCLFGRTPVAMAAISALCLSLHGNLAQAAWTHAHGDSDNSGFAKVVTAPAVAYTAIADVGPVAPGANPVTGQDGTVYIGNLNGELIALHPDGTPFWRRKLDGGPDYGAIHASPVVGEDGSIYVMSGIGFRDHREGNPKYGAFSFLHKFTPGGGWLGSAPFPLHDRTTGATKAPPNVWNFNGAEAIVIPVQFGVDAQTTRLVAFSTTLDVLADIPVTPDEITGGGPEWFSTLGDVLFGIGEVIYCYNPFSTLYRYIRYGRPDSGDCDSVGWVPVTYTPPQDQISLYSYLGSPYGVAIRQRAATESPHLFVVDGINDTVEYTFDITTGFREVNRSHNDERENLSTPVALASGGIVIGKHTRHEIRGGISFEPEQRYLGLDGDIVATPTVTPNGRIAAVASTGWLSTVLDGSLEQQQWNDGPSIASAASSCTHLFVATENELVTYDLATLQGVNRLPWTDGGQHSTIIGPAGHVYATTEHGIYVFPPAPNRNPNDTAGTQCVPDPTPPAVIAPPPSVGIQPASLTETRVGNGVLSVTATAAITDGQPPFTYSWTANGLISVHNPTDAATSVSATLETCDTVDGEVVLTVTDAGGRQAQATAPVYFEALLRRGQQCP